MQTTTVLGVIATSTLCLALSAQATPPRQVAAYIPTTAVATHSVTAARADLAPLPAGKALSTHAPYAAGECKVCHQSNDPLRPGKVLARGATSCTGCHDQMNELRSHRAMQGDCISCHNPHDATTRSLLR